MNQIRIICVVVVLAAATLLRPAHAQSDDPPAGGTTVADVVIVPDLTGLNPPQAAAELNRAGLRYGGESAITAGGSQPHGTVAAQTPPPASAAEFGAPVEILVAHAPNTRLIYDNNDLTLLYFGTQPLNVSAIEMQAAGAARAAFQGARWGARVVSGECVQVWSIRRTEPKQVGGCRLIDRWITTTDPAQHVWTQSAGAERFIVRQDGIDRAECEAAPRDAEDQPVACEFYLSEGDDITTWPYVYFAYTRDTLVVRNASPDSWMRLNVTITPLRGPSFQLTAPALYTALDGVVLSQNNNGSLILRQLAPNQCVRFRTETAAPHLLPEPCLLFADTIVDGLPFWAADFRVGRREDGEHLCAAAAINAVTICRVPR